MTSYTESDHSKVILDPASRILRLRWKSIAIADALNQQLIELGDFNDKCILQKL